MIKPTVGRIVWFTPPAKGAPGFASPATGEPLAAIIAAVLLGRPGDLDIVNLTVFDAVGVPHAITMVPLMQESDDVPPDGFFATWMPYQIGQAKKHADEQQTAKNMAIAESHDYAAESRRAQLLDMALHTPGVIGHRQVLDAAAAYQAHIAGAPAAASQQPAPGAAFPSYSTMQPHQQRVVDEKVELDARLAKLVPFFDTPTFVALDVGEKLRLERQAQVMQLYSDILDDRIAAFTPA